MRKANLSFSCESPWFFFCLGQVKYRKKQYENKHTTGTIQPKERRNKKTATTVALDRVCVQV